VYFCNLKKHLQTLKYISKTIFSTLLFIFILQFSLSAQNQAQVFGKVTDSKDKTALIGANVTLYSLPDSAFKKGVSADMEGRFSFSELPKGKYFIKVSFIGYDDQFKAIEIAETPVRVGMIALSPSVTELKSVEIKTKAITAIQKEDTTELNASAYKTTKDASAEDLIAKMPGVTIQNGQIQSQGEQVRQVFIDGKPFMGNDPNAALKNLPAEVIDKIQVFDRLSEQAQFTGVNDGNTTKTINIITKPTMRNGKFGKVFAGYGTNDLYKAGGNINHFEKDRRITIVGQSNNINEQNFSSEDLMGVVANSQGSGGGRGGMGGRGGGGGGWRGPSGGSDVNDFLISNANGIAQTHALGINYSDKWGKKADIASSYFFNRTNSNAIQSTNREFVSDADSGRKYIENSQSKTVNTNHRFNMRLDYKFDTSNSILITPKISVQQNNGTSSSLGENTFNALTLNNTNNNFSTDLSGYNISNTALYRHKFKKVGRTFSLNFTNTHQNNTGDNQLFAENNFLVGRLRSDTLDQNADLQKNGSNLNTNLTFTEAISTKSFLNLSYTNVYRIDESSKLTYNEQQNNVRLDTILSSVFKSNYVSHNTGLGYRYMSGKIMSFYNFSYQYAELNNRSEFPFILNTNRYFHNVLPFAMFRYNISKDKNFRIVYRTNTNIPSVDQLQDVVNNTNPLLLSVGNSALKQSFQNNLFLRYSSTNVTKGTSFFYMIGGSVTNNHIGRSTFIANVDTTIEGVSLRRGSQLSKPVNVDGYFNLRSFANYSIPLAKLKSNLSLNGGITFVRTPGVINNEINFANSPVFTGGVVLSSNISQYIDFTISSNSSYNFVQNTLNTNLNSTFFNQNSQFKIRWIIAKDFVITTDVSHLYFSGLSQGFNQNFILWNGGIGYKFFKDKSGELMLSTFDALKQNNTVSRNVTETYVEDIRTNVLQRYFMLTFTYNIRKYKIDESK
jgi:hypothetical protein